MRGANQTISSTSRVEHPKNCTWTKLRCSLHEMSYVLNGLALCFLEIFGRASSAYCARSTSCGTDTDTEDTECQVRQVKSTGEIAWRQIRVSRHVLTCLDMSRLILYHFVADEHNRIIESSNHPRSSVRRCDDHMICDMQSDTQTSQDLAALEKCSGPGKGSSTAAPRNFVRGSTTIHNIPQHTTTANPIVTPIVLL